MKDRSSPLLDKAARSIDAARRLAGAGDNDFAVERLYYAMFYVAEALLHARGMPTSAVMVQSMPPSASTSPNRASWTRSSIAGCSTPSGHDRRAPTTCSPSRPASRSPTSGGGGGVPARGSWIHGGGLTHP